MTGAKIRYAFRLLVLLSVCSLSFLSASEARASDGPELSEQCQSLKVQVGNKLAFHVYARGAQIYKWNGATWDFVAPVATLYAEPTYFGEVGMHYVGPTWESKSGSLVKGRRVQGAGCTPDPNSIPWLLLERASSSGAGIFSAVTYIQRVNTNGGNVPTEPGITLNETRSVPYTAEYYFYRKDD